MLLSSRREDTLGPPPTQREPLSGGSGGDRAIASPPESALEPFGPIAREWFARRFGTPTPVQREGWPRIARGAHTLLIAPTGSGKTLAAFLSCIDRLTRRPPETAGVRVLYVSPLKALVYDIERNLRAPLAEMRRSVWPSGLDGDPPLPRVAVRTGDTPQRERRQQAHDPAEILVTTPESLFLILGSRQRETLATVETIIVDEIHALAPTKRGAHLAISLERVAAAARGEPQRIGLSATARPLGEVARFLGGDREVRIVDASTRPLLDLEISVPVPDMTNVVTPEPDVSAKLDLPHGDRHRGRSRRDRLPDSRAEGSRGPDRRSSSEGLQDQRESRRSETGMFASTTVHSTWPPFLPEQGNGLRDLDVSGNLRE